MRRRDAFAMIVSEGLVAALVSCGGTKPEPYVRPASETEAAARVMVPHAPPPALPPPVEIADASSPPSESDAKKIPDEPAQDPTPPDDGPKPAAHKKVDALLAAIEGAETIEIHNSWNGLGNTFAMFIRLERKGDEVTYRAKIGDWHDSIGERVADPTEPREPHARACRCAIDATCPCERVKATKSGKTSWANIAPFLHRLSRKRVDRKQDYRTGPEHTDDYPHIHIVLSGKALATPLHLSVRDNQRHWQANGLFIQPDPLPAPYETTMIVIGPVGSASRTEKQTIQPTAKHERVNTSFHRMLALIGAREWMDELSKSR